MRYWTVLEALESDWVKDSVGWVEVDQEPSTLLDGPREEGLLGGTQAEVV